LVKGSDSDMDIKLITTPAGVQNAWDQVTLHAKMGDLGDAQYRTLLALSAMLELLVEKGLITRQELEAKAAQLEAADNEPLKAISALFDPKE
jgi:hypothetical protein